MAKRSMRKRLRLRLHSKNKLIPNPANILQSLICAHITLRALLPLELNIGNRTMILQKKPHLEMKFAGKKNRNLHRAHFPLTPSDAAFTNTHSEPGRV